MPKITTDSIREYLIMKNSYKKIFGVLTALTFAVLFLTVPSAVAEECSESRVGASEVEVVEIEPGVMNVKCSDRTEAVLFWGDPFTDTVEMGPMPEAAGGDYLTEEAVVRSRKDQLMFYPCNNCHGNFVKIPSSTKPRVITNNQYPHESYAPRDPKDLKHGKGAIWCLDCHSRTNRNVLIDHRGKKISFDQPQKLCGKCHGQILRDWREGIHGKRTGGWEPGAKKRWWVCTECHNPHDVEPPFKPLEPEAAPELPKGMHNTDHETGGHH